MSRWRRLGIWFQSIGSTLWLMFHPEIRKRLEDDEEYGDFGDVPRPGGDDAA